MFEFVYAFSERTDFFYYYVLVFVFFVDFFAVYPYDAPGDAYDRGVRGYVFKHDAARADFGVFADGDAAENFRPAGYYRAGFYDGVTPFARFLARAALSDALIDYDAFFDFGGFAYDDACAVIDENARRYFRRGMNFDTREKFCSLAYHPRQQFEVYFIKEMRDPVSRKGVNARIRQPDLEFRPCRGVALFCEIYIFS